MWLFELTVDLKWKQKRTRAFEGVNWARAMEGWLVGGFKMHF